MREFVPPDDFAAFHRILTKHAIPYMIGVTPQPALCPLEPHDARTRDLSDAECQILRRILEDGVSIGLHGVTHRTRQQRPHAEFMAIDDAFFQELIAYGDLQLQRLTGIRADIFVPPFNRISRTQLDLLSRPFRIVCGGPESTVALGTLGAL